MQVLVNTDKNLTGTAPLSTYVEAEVTAALDRFGERITRIEVHLGDENSGKSGADDKRCTMEARLAGRAPLAVTAQATSYELAIEGAADKLARALDSALARGEARTNETVRSGERNLE